jgi:hypothetical protein
MRHWLIREIMTIVTVVETPEFQRRARTLMSDAEQLELIDFVAQSSTREALPTTYRSKR